MSQKNQPLARGTRVRVIGPNEEQRSEWTDEGWAKKRSNVEGVIVDHNASHGLFYNVRHDDDGTTGPYDPSEFIVLESEHVVTVSVSGRQAYERVFEKASDALSMQTAMITVLNAAGHKSWGSHDFLLGGVEGEGDPFIQILLRERPKQHTR